MRPRNILALHAAALASLGLAAVALASEPLDPMAAFYGNTIMIAVPAGDYYARRYVDPDGAWREPRGDGWIKGVWRIEGGQVCSWQTEPEVRNPQRYCYPPVARKVGETWVTVDPQTGNEVIQTLVRGRD
ncbi:hypothetical protein [Phenylobacterium sp.]|uniref:hypothetical protein n=1 Tax=Phenylobacterium sp. TaxID=1871053 RepID=UPI0035ADB614